MNALSRSGETLADPHHEDGLVRHGEHDPRALPERVRGADPGREVSTTGPYPVSPPAGASIPRRPLFGRARVLPERFRQARGGAAGASAQ